MFKAISKIFSYRRYPMLWVVIYTIGGILLWSETNHDFRYILYGLALAALLIDIVFKRAQPLVYSLIILAAYTLAQHSTPTKPPISYNQEAIFVGKLQSNPILQGKWYKATLDIIATQDSSEKWSNTSYTLFCGLDSTARDMRINDTICLKGSLRRIQGGYGKYVFKEGVVGQVYSYQSTILGKASGTWGGYLQSLRDGAREKIVLLDSTKRDAIAVYSAMVIGERSALNQETIQTYRNSGASHLLAISGLHIGVVVILLNLMLGALKFIGRRGRVIYSILIILGLWLYAIFSGMSVSVERAAIMFTLYQLSLLLHRSTRSLNTLATAAAIILLFAPYSIYNIGFQLSFMAMVGIFIFYHPLVAFITIKNRVARTFLCAVAISLSAQLGIVPLLAFHFGEVAWMGIILSVFIWVTVPAIILCGLLYIITSIGFLGHIALWVTDIQNTVFAMVAGWEWAVVRDIRLSLLELLFSYILIFLFGILLNNMAQKYSRAKLLRVKLLR
ncbi:MAG: ComEC/Rec2 family competence protein [Rikenellaceae bacterium]